MSLKEAYKKKAEAELELAQARLAEFRAKAKNFTAEAHLKYAKQLDDFEHGIDTTKVKAERAGRGWRRCMGEAQGWGGECIAVIKCCSSGYCRQDKRLTGS